MNNAGFPTAADYAQNTTDNARDETRRLSLALASALTTVANLKTRVEMLEQRLDDLTAPE